MLPEKDRIRLQHMLDDTREALSFVKDCSRDDLDKQPMLLRALVNCIGIVGEAAAHVSEDTQSQIPDIPWGAIIGMRNRLVHGYFDINKDIVWATVTRDLLDLEKKLVAVLK